MASARSPLVTALTLIVFTVLCFHNADAGTVYTFGNETFGGKPISDGVDVTAQLRDLKDPVMQVAATGFAFAAVRKSGKVVVWGRTDRGGSTKKLKAAGADTGVKSVVGCRLGAFAALKTNGKVTSWGRVLSGGSGAITADVEKRLDALDSISNLYATPYGGWLAVDSKGRVEVWGDPTAGGSLAKAASSVANDLKSGVAQVFSTDHAFAVIKADKTVVSWGPDVFKETGVDASTLVTYESVKAKLVNVEQIVSTQNAFAARTAAGAVVVWGSKKHGAYPDNGATDGEVCLRFLIEFCACLFAAVSVVPYAVNARDEPCTLCTSVACSLHRARYAD